MILALQNKKRRRRMCVVAENYGYANERLLM